MIHRHYKLLTDFKRVSDFLCSNYTIKELNGYLLQPFFEYAHTHPYFNHKLTHRFGLWEDNGNIVAIVCYEMDLGESFLSVKSGYEYLLPDLIKHSESELAVIKDTKHMLGIWVTDTQSIYIKLLKENGYQKVHSEPVTIFSYDNDFLDVRLPDSFSAISLEDENDFIKINECIWKGFN